MDELRGNLRPGHPMARKKDGAGGEARRGGGVGARSAREARREAFRGASSKLAASREHFDVVVSALERERRAHGETKSKYEELGAHANVVLRQRDDARASLEASTSRERAASRRVDELSKRLDEERSVSETRLDELRRANETWRATQVTEIDAMRRAAEARMRDAEEAAARGRIASPSAWRTARDAWAKPSVRRPRARETPSDDLGRWHRRPKCERRERRTRFERKCNNWRTTSPRAPARAFGVQRAPPRQRSERWTTLWDSLNRIKPNLRARATSFTLETANWRTRDEICERRASSSTTREAERGDSSRKTQISPSKCRRSRKSWATSVVTSATS